MACGSSVIGTITLIIVIIPYATPLLMIVAVGYFMVQVHVYY